MTNFSHLSLLYSIGMNHIKTLFPVVLLLFHAHQLPWECIYWAVAWQWSHRKCRLFYWWVLIRYCGHLFTTSWPSNDCFYLSHYSGFQPSCHIAPSLRLLIPNSLQTTISSPRGCVCDVCDHPCELHLSVMLALMILLPVCGHRTFEIGWCSYSASM
jgi:hypothetical protein